MLYIPFWGCFFGKKEIYSQNGDMCGGEFPILFKQFVCCYLTTGAAGVHVVVETLRGDVCRYDGLCGGGGFFEGAYASLHPLVVVFVDYVFADAVFHFADGDGLVLSPVFGVNVYTKTIVHGVCKVDKLCRQRRVFLACHPKNELVFKEFFNQESLANTPAPVDGYELRPDGSYIFIEPFDFVFASYNFVSHVDGCLVIICRKVTKKMRLRQIITSKPVAISQKKRDCDKL